MDLALNNLHRFICHKIQTNKQTNFKPVIPRIHQLFLCRGVRPPKDCPGYDTKQSDSEITLMMDLWGNAEYNWPGVVAPDRVLFIGQIELNCTLMLN